jgi:hypothetical protein
MIKTYTETPDFGDASKFQYELDLLSQKVQKLEVDLTTLNRDLDLVESKMNLNMRHSLLTSPSRSLLSVNTSSSGSRISSNSIGSDISKDPVDIEERHESNEGDGEHQVVEDNHEKNVQATIDNHNIHQRDTSEEMAEVNSDSVNISKDDWDEEFETEYPALPVQRLMAMYSYEGTEEGRMDLGDKFEVLGTDAEGWIKVRREGFIEEGFIPTTFTQSL